MTEDKPAKVGALLLAAGGSTRLGEPKQLLRLDGKTLLRGAAEIIAASLCEPVLIVLGAEVERSKTEIQDLPITVSINPDWQSGMSSSIKAGLIELLKAGPDIDAVLILLCDQPHVTTADINRFVEEFRRTGAPIIASRYDDVMGVPALFSRGMFAELLELKGDKGARDLIRGGHPEIVTLDLQHAAFDIDTRDDVNRLS